LHPPRLEQRRIFLHHDFSRCTAEAPRRVSHTIVLYAMLALVLVDLWVITARYNPLRSGLVYPLGISDPWKLLANLAGVALIVGCALMTRDRLRRRQADGARPTGTYSDWLLLGLLMAVALSGFATEVLHLLRLDGPRLWAYFAHLVIVLTFFVLLPYSKLAHVGFRTVALVAAEKAGQREPVTALGLESKGAT
jgi:quinone-modifying oxidoreductase subunit QmoC